MNASDYIVFVDESGDHGLETIDPQFPVFVLAFCILAKTAYSRFVLPSVTEFKFAHFGHDQVILHERDIRKDLGDFSILREPARKAAFLAELTALIDAAPMTIIASVIRKDLLVDRYAYPNNPYQIALGFGLERVAAWLRRQNASGALPSSLSAAANVRTMNWNSNFDGSALVQTIDVSSSPSSRVSCRNPVTFPDFKSPTSSHGRSLVTS